MEEDLLFYQGGIGGGINRRKLEEILIDLVDVSLYNKIKEKFQRPESEDLTFMSNEKFWQHVISNRAYPDQYITLSNFILTELPMSPGLFHTDKARHSRRRAERNVVRTSIGIKSFPFTSRFKDLDNTPIKDRVAVELNPSGKMSMVLGGIGALRLKPKQMFEDQRVFLMGASSSGVCHEGVPVILPSNLYSKVISQIKENCGIKCKLVGRLRILPTEESPIIYNREIPKYCLLVEDITNIEPCRPKDILVSVAIAYSENLRYLREKDWSFVSFNPDSTDRQLIYSAEWLHDYAIRYSGVIDPVVLGDFDEFRQHFRKIEFSLKDLANGKVDFAKLAQYEEFLNFKVVNIMGDYFNNINNSTIINKSIVQNAFNKIKDRFDEDTATVLAKIAKIIEESGNKDAGELFDAFNEEIEKSEPKKSLLKTFWTGLQNLLPVLSSTAGIAEKVLKIIGV